MCHCVVLRRKWATVSGESVANSLCAPRWRRVSRGRAGIVAARRRPRRGRVAEAVGHADDAARPELLLARALERASAGAERGSRFSQWPFVSSAHASTAAATASLYSLSAWYCSALPPRWIFLHICLWPRRQWSCWQVELQ